MIKQMLKKIFYIFMALICILKPVLATDITNDIDITEEEIREVMNTSGIPKILSKVALLYDKKYDKILYEKNSELVVPNASTTKILTAIVAYENGNMDDIVTVSGRAASIGGSTIKLRSGDKVVLSDLMKGMLIYSGNDAAMAVAEHVGGSVENFCNMMNERAIELGAMNTHFVTPHGLDNDEHYTTAKDLLIFAKYLIDIPYLADIVNMRSATLKINDYNREINNTNEMLGIYQETNGIKTGYTSKAGRCLVTSMSKDGRTLISIVLGADSKKQRTSDSIALMKYGYSEFCEVDIYEKMVKHFELNIYKSKNKYYSLVLTGNNYTILSISGNNITYEYEIYNNLEAPVFKGTIIGNIKIYNNSELINIVELKIPEDIKRKTVVDYAIELMKKQKSYIQINI